jgi:hypothetical protein
VSILSGWETLDLCHKLCSTDRRVDRNSEGSLVDRNSEGSLVDRNSEGSLVDCNSEGSLVDRNSEWSVLCGQWNHKTDEPPSDSHRVLLKLSTRHRNLINDILVLGIMAIFLSNLLLQ